MKKLFLLIAIFISGVIYAQDPVPEDITLADPVETKKAPEKAPCDDCEVRQIRTRFSGLDENVSDINQRGKKNKANVWQNGSGNLAQIDQDGLYDPMGGIKNKSVIYQDGYSNTALVDQNGENNKGKIIQMGDMNYARQVVGVGWAENNMAYIKQKGNGNAALQRQYYDNNDARIKQKGDDNTARQYQRSRRNEATGSFASALQVGSENGVSQAQRGSFNIAITEQRGNGNTSVEDQRSGADFGDFSAPPGIDANFSSVYQDGNNNMHCLDQLAAGGYNGNFVTQMGNKNEAIINQTSFGAGNLSFITQVGNKNMACVQQTGGEISVIPE